MKTVLFPLVLALFLAGCEVTYDSNSYEESLYVDGSYGWVVHEYTIPYTYDYYQNNSLYLETPYLPRGTKVFVDIYNDFNYAYMDVEGWSMYLYDQWFDGAYEAHYVYEVSEDGYHYFNIQELHPDAEVYVYFSID